MIAPELLNELAASRTAIARDTTRLKASLDFPERTRLAIRQRPVVWLGGAAVVGFLTAWLSPRSRPAAPVKVRVGKSAKAEAVQEAAKSATWIGTALALGRFLLPLVRPAVTAFAARRLSEMASKLG